MLTIVWLMLESKEVVFPNTRYETVVRHKSVYCPSFSFPKNEVEEVLSVINDMYPNCHYRIVDGVEHTVEEAEQELLEIAQFG